MFIVSDDTVRARIIDTQIDEVSSTGMFACAITLLNGTKLVDTGASRTEAFDKVFARARELEVYLFRDKDYTATAGDIPGNFGIGEAVALMKTGRKVARLGWNGKGMYLIWVDDQEWNVSPTISSMASDATEGRFGFFAMRTADGKLVPWLCSQADLAAIDYVLVN